MVGTKSLIKSDMSRDCRTFTKHGNADHNTDYRYSKHPVLHRNVEYQFVDFQRLSGMAPEAVAPDALLRTRPRRC